MAAAVGSLDLTFMAGSTMVSSSHFDRPISDASNIVPANGTMNTRELMTVDADAAHPFARSVQARVTYGDGASFTATASGTFDVPALSGPAPPPSPTVYTLTGVISDTGTQRPIAGARVEILNGVNAAKATTTDGSGAYTLGDLSADTFRMRASAAGYDSGEQNLTIPGSSRADMLLRATAASAPCAYTMSPGGLWEISRSPNDLNLTITRTSGTCGWTIASDVDWISFAVVSGNGNTPVTFVVSARANALFSSRTGIVTVKWNGGEAQLTVRQAPDTPAYCQVSVKVNGQGPSISIGAAGGTLTALLEPAQFLPPGICSMWTATITAPGTVANPNRGIIPGSVTFTIPPNTTSALRTFLLTISFDNSPIGTGMQISQSGTP